MVWVAGMDGKRLALSAVLTLMMLAGCSGEKRVASAPPVAPVAAPAPIAAAAPARPEGADAVDNALTDVQLFNATATESLADIATDETQIRDLAVKASDLARRAETAPAAQRPGLAKSLAVALADREAAHAALGQSLEAYRTTSAETTGLVAAAVALCGPIPPPPAPPPPGTLAAYPPCATLAVEQASLAANIAALSKAFESAEAAYRQDRRRIDEAAATMALVR